MRVLYQSVPVVQLYCDGTVVKQECLMNTEQYNTRYWKTNYKFHVLQSLGE